jgi:DNA-binding NarL/FixJ family response regulator
MTQGSLADAIERALGGRVAEFAEFAIATPAAVAVLAALVAAMGLQRAADVVLDAVGGAGMPAVVPDERPAAYDLLSRAADDRGDARAARAWARRAAPIGVPPRRRRGSGPGWENLSPREQQVALLAAEGYSNSRIAQTLLLSERTVQSHLSRALGALQVSSRAAIPARLRGTPIVPERLDGLTDRQREVAVLIAEGCPNREISARLGITDKTVEKHVQAIFERWDVRSRTAIARRVFEPA